jgi:hypothetical protein
VCCVNNYVCFLSYIYLWHVLHPFIWISWTYNKYKYSYVTGSGGSLSYPAIHHYLIQNIGASTVSEHIYLLLALSKSTWDKNSGITPINRAQIQSPSLVFLWWLDAKLYVTIIISWTDRSLLPDRDLTNTPSTLLQPTINLRPGTQTTVG